MSETCLVCQQEIEKVLPKNRIEKEISPGEKVNWIICSDCLKKEVLVCEECMCSCCFQGELYCENYRSAGITKMPIELLTVMAKEHPSYWRE